MPITKHHKKKYPNSEWVRRRNIRRAAQRLVSKTDISDTVVDTVASTENLEQVHSSPVKPKQKGLWQRSMGAIKRAFVGQRGS
tara:strand:+ start:2029 stop:2277 length:249 start_codon:yes stop_codon:yes gene_type:complete